MDDTIVTIYCLCEDFLKASGYRDDPQVRLSSAEVMTVALVGAGLLDGNIEKARSFSGEYGYMPTMISRSRFNRRLHAIDPTLWSRGPAYGPQVVKRNSVLFADQGVDKAQTCDLGCVVCW